MISPPYRSAAAKIKMSSSWLAIGRETIELKRRHGAGWIRQNPIPPLTHDNGLRIVDVLQDQARREVRLVVFSLDADISRF